MSTPIRWLFLSNMFPSITDPSYGAFVARSLEDLLAEGIDVRHVVVIHGRQAYGKKLLAYGRYFYQLLKAGIFGRIDAIYAHYASHHCLPIALLNIVFRKRLVLHIHGDDLAIRSGWSRTLNRVGQGVLVHRADLIVVPSAYFSDMLRSIYPDVPSPRILVSPSSGVDTGAYAKHDAVVTPDQWNLVLSKPAVQVGFVGRIDKDKGWELLAQAWSLLPPAERSRVHLNFWGSGQEVGKLENYIAEIGAKNSTFHGPVSPERVPEVHRQFDIQVVPSYRESLGLSALEGMAAGHIVLCSDIRPFIDLITDGEQAMLFRSGDPASLGEVLSRTVNMPADRLAQISAEARRLALEFDRRTVARRLSLSIRDQLCPK